MPQCSSEPMIIEAVPPPSHLGKYSHFARALFICSSLYLRSCSAYAWHLCHFGLPIHNHVVAHRLFAAKASLDEQKNSGPMDSAGSDSLLGSLELMMDKTSPPGKGDSLMVLHDLRRKRDDLSALDLSNRIKSMAARLRADREEQRHEAAKLKAIREMPQEELASNGWRTRWMRSAEPVTGHIWMCCGPNALWARLNELQTRHIFSARAHSPPSICWKVPSGC